MAEILLRETKADFGRLMEERGASIHRIRAKIVLRTGGRFRARGSWRWIRRGVRVTSAADLSGF
jgi:hypothetical protein